MKYLTRHILIWLFLFYGFGAFASHILGGDISYKYLKDNQYKITLNIYRDCNGCKINGKGGGSSAEDCSEIDYLYVKGIDSSGYKETKFSLTRESITDITPICYSGISACQKNSNSIFGIERQQFTAIIDLDNSKITGFCHYYIYITLAERNADITTGQASQNFCIDAYLNQCIATDKNSPEFNLVPEFIVNSNKAQFKSFQVSKTEIDSVVYKLTPALVGLNKATTYTKGFSYDNPLSNYCVDYPCKPDKTTNPPQGFYIDSSNGDMVYTPVKDGERAVLAVKVEFFKKISGQWEYTGYIKRDIQIYVISGNGNNSPTILSKDYFEICEEELFELKIEAGDLKNSLTSAEDTVHFEWNSPVSEADFNEYPQSSAPFNYGLMRWKPKQGTSQNRIYRFLVSARDNACPLNAIGSKSISIKVIAKEPLKLNHVSLGCGNFEISTSKFDPTSSLQINVHSLSGNKNVFNTTKSLDTLTFLPSGTYLVQGLLRNQNGCVTEVWDTLYNNPIFSSKLLGDSNVCPNSLNDYLIINSFNRKAKIEWYFDSSRVGGNNSALNISFIKNGNLKATIALQKGKWYCLNKLEKNITIIQLPKIKSPDEIRVCHGTGDYELDSLSINPSGGYWISSSPWLHQNKINTSGLSNDYDDTINLTYEIDLGCKVSKDITFILEALPPFELSSISICEMKTPVRFEQLIHKPYNPLDYSFIWGLSVDPQKIKFENGKALIYPADFGFGKIEYFGEVLGKNGCKNYDTSIIEFTKAVNITFKNPVSVCQGSGEMDINTLNGVSPQGGTWSFYDFELFKNRTTLLTDSCGVFEVSYTYDNYGCYDSQKDTVRIVCKPKIDILNFPSKICDSELPLTLNAAPAGGFWDSPNITGGVFNPPIHTKPVDYKLAYKVANGACIFKKEISVNIAPSPIIKANTEKTVYCQSEEINFNGTVQNSDHLKLTYLNGLRELDISGTLNISNELSFTAWFDKASKLSSQTIHLLANNSYGCASAENYSIQVYDKPFISLLNDTSVCEKADCFLFPLITYSGHESLNVSWLDGMTPLNNAINFSTKSLASGLHNLHFKTDNGFCSDEKSILVAIKPQPKVDFIIQPSDVASILKPEFQFINRSQDNLAFLWDFGTNPTSISADINPLKSYVDTGSYSVSLLGTDTYGCSTLISKTLFVKPDILVFIPNAFTPNNKDVEENNVFSVSVDNYLSFTMEIFDRWGHKVYQSNNPSETWNGKSGEVFCTPDVYFYSVKVSSFTNHWYQYKGTITLIK